MSKDASLFNLLGGFLIYLEKEKRFSAHTLIAYQNDLKQFMVFISGKFPDNAANTINPEQITPKHIRSWLARLMAQGYHPASVARKLSSIKALYWYLQKRHNCPVNPAQSVKTPKKPQQLPAWIEQPRMDQLFDASTDFFAPNFKGQTEYLILDLLYATGIRRSELTQLKITDLDAANGILHINGKRNKQRNIPISQRLSQALQHYILYVRNERFKDSADHSLFLTNLGNSIYPEYVYRIVRKYLNYITTQKHRSPHTIRHTTATHLLDQGGDLNAIKDLLGHSSLASTQVYTHNTIEKLKQVYQKAHPKGEG